MVHPYLASELAAPFQVDSLDLKTFLDEGFTATMKYTMFGCTTEGTQDRIEV